MSRWRAHLLRLDLRDPGLGVDALLIPLLREAVVTAAREVWQSNDCPVACAVAAFLLGSRNLVANQWHRIGDRAPGVDCAHAVRIRACAVKRDVCQQTSGEIAAVVELQNVYASEIRPVRLIDYGLSIWLAAGFAGVSKLPLNSGVGSDEVNLYVAHRLSHGVVYVRAGGSAAASELHS